MIGRSRSLLTRCRIVQALDVRIKAPWEMCTEMHAVILYADENPLTSVEILRFTFVSLRAEFGSQCLMS